MEETDQKPYIFLWSDPVGRFGGRVKRSQKTLFRNVCYAKIEKMDDLEGILGRTR